MDAGNRAQLLCGRGPCAAVHSGAGLWETTELGWTAEVADAWCSSDGGVWRRGESTWTEGGSLCSLLERAMDGLPYLYEGRPARGWRGAQCTFGEHRIGSRAGLSRRPAAAEAVLPQKQCFCSNQPSNHCVVTKSSSTDGWCHAQVPQCHTPGHAVSPCPGSVASPVAFSRSRRN